METRLYELYRDYKRRLDVRQVLDHYGAENVSEVVSADGTTELVHSCLLDRIEPHHANGDAHPSAWVNVEKGLYCCAVYWAGDIFHLIQKLEGKEDLNGVMPVVSNFLTGATKDEVSLREEFEAMFAEPVYSVDLPSYSERVLDPWMVSHPYMYDVRGISMEAHTRLKIGFDEKENRIVFPHFWDGRLVGWQKRSIPAASGWPGTCPDWPKYRSSSGFPKSETLYGYDEAKRIKSRQVVVVESPMSVAKAISLWIGIPVLATFGAKVSQAQIDLLKDFDYVTVWFDDDPAGHAGERKIVENLYRHTSVGVVAPDPGMDMADYSDGESVCNKLDSEVPAAFWLAERDREELSL
jgi:hypothetical protein